MRITPTMVADSIGEPMVALDLLPAWEQAMKCMPDGSWDALDPDNIPERRKECGLPENTEPPLLAVAERIIADRCLRALAWYLHWRVFTAPQTGRFYNLPTLEYSLGPLSGAFYLLLSLEFAPALKRAGRSSGYPPSVTSQAIARVCEFEKNHRRGRGSPGLYRSQYSWLRTFFMGPCVRLGRFEYELGTASEDIRAWHRRDGAVMVMAAAGQRFRSDGLAADGDDDDNWTATLRHEDGCFAGFPILPEGRALRREIRLSTSEWEPFLAPGVDALKLHIPNGGGMSFDACVESFRAARHFFSTHHPNRRPRAITCSTWFLDPRLHLILPGSNPATFQSALYCYPALLRRNGGLWFVFLDAIDSPPERLPRDTSLQKALADFLATGRRWHGGSMMIPFEDADDLRKNRYRDAFETLRREFQI